MTETKTKQDAGAINSDIRALADSIRKTDSTIRTLQDEVDAASASSTNTTTTVFLSSPTFTGSTIFSAPASFTSTMTASEVQVDRVCIGDPATGSLLNTAGAGCIWAKSVDNITQASGCVVAVVITSTGTNGVAVVTSTTTYIDVTTKTPGVLLESCSPGALCRVGISGIFRVNFGYNTGSGYLTNSNSARCIVTDTSAFDGNTIGYQAGPRIGTSGNIWMRLR